MKKKLSNNQMRNFVARLFKKEDLAFSNGKVSLSDEEKAQVVKVYGQTFLNRLLAADFDADGEATALHDTLVEELASNRALVATLQDTINALAAEPEPSPASHGAGAGVPAIRINMNAAHNRIAREFAETGRMPVAGDSSIDVADLNQEFSQAMPPKYRLELVSKRIYAGFPDADKLTKVNNNSDYIAANGFLSEISQQFTPAWTPKGKMKFTPRVIKYRRHKINVSIKPAEIIGSWLLWLYQQGKTFAEMPITRYILEEHIVPKVLDDITLSMLGKGKYVAAGSKSDGDEGTAAVNSMDGFETQLVEGKTTEGCKMNFLADAVDPYTLPDEQLLKYVDGFADKISPLFAGKMDIYVAPELITAYRRAYKAVYGKFTGTDTGTSIEFTRFKLIGLQSMYRSPILLATPKENFVMLVDLVNANNVIQKIEEHHYDVDILGEYSLSVGFRVEEAVYASVPDGYTPSEAIAIDPTDGGVWVNGGASSDDSGSDDSDDSDGEGA